MSDLHFYTQHDHVPTSAKVRVTSLLFVKARFYTLLEPSKKTFAWEDRYIIHCSGASATVLVTVDGTFLPQPDHDSTNAPERVER